MDTQMIPRTKEVTSMAAFKNFLTSQGAEPEAEQYLSGVSFARKIGRGKHVLRAGDVCKYYYFISKGMLRGYISKNDDEITVWVAVEGDVVTSFSSLLEGRLLPATSSIQAIEESIIVYIPAEAVDKGCIQFASVNTLTRKMLEHYMQQAIEKNIISSLPVAGKKYAAFIHKFPHLANRLPLKYVASLLGITIETLSRIRRKAALKASGKSPENIE